MTVGGRIGVRVGQIRRHLGSGGMKMWVGWTGRGMVVVVRAIELMRRRLTIVSSGSGACRCGSGWVAEGLGGSADGRDRTRGLSEAGFLGGHLLGAETTCERQSGWFFASIGGSSGLFGLQLVMGCCSFDSRDCREG